MKKLENKKEFVDQYIRYIELANEIPNSYCTKPYLMMRNDIQPYEDDLGLVGLKHVRGKNFFLPPYRLEDDVPVFFKGYAENSFPTLTNNGKYTRKDVNYFMERENSISILSTDLEIRTAMKKCKFDCYPMSIKEASKSAMLKKFYKRITPGRYTDYKNLYDWFYLKKFMFKDFGQNLFVLEFENEILACIIWSDNGLYPTVHFDIGTSSSRKKQGAHEKCFPVLHSTSLLNALFFMRSFPEGTCFNFGRVGASKFTKKALERTYPAKILEITTCEKAVYPKPVGTLVWEEWRKSKGLAIINRMLFYPVWRMVIDNDKRVHPQIAEHMKRMVKNNKSVVRTMRDEAQTARELEIALNIQMFKNRILDEMKTEIIDADKCKAIE